MDEVIFDTGAFIAGLENFFSLVFTTQLVIEEIKDIRSSTNLELGLSANKIVILTPSKEGVAKIQDTCKRIGEFSLSDADISIAALALDFNNSLVFTDDYSLQNILKIFKIRFNPVRMFGIKDARRFEYVCNSCKKRFSEPIKRCKVCGGHVRKKPLLTVSDRP
ncbi:hypothetical protein HS7_09760 [Sulfolobales archaeon HS-7]|nr:hypothetical protein HS7_09760 [Sulfolobales archaeon HS-7]